MERFKCCKCTKTFTQQDKLLKHINFYHSEQETQLVPPKEFMKGLKCGRCAKSFNLLDSFRKHVKSFHPDKATLCIPRKKFNFSCDICHKNFSNKRHFSYHQKQHKTDEHVIISNLKKCPLCDFSSPAKEYMHEHFQESHSFEIKSQNKRFASFAEFITWKKDIENKTQSYFIKKEGSFAGSNHTVARYYCHRSGNFISKSQGKYQLKMQGSNKINAYCPAEIRLFSHNSGICDITYQETHVGHTNDIKHLFLTKNERGVLAEKISSKIPFSQILGDTRVSLHPDFELERIHMLTRKDLHNIEKSLIRLKSMEVQCQTDVLVGGKNKGVIPEENNAMNEKATVLQRFITPENSLPTKKIVSDVEVPSLNFVNIPADEEIIERRVFTTKGHLQTLRLTKLSSEESENILAQLKGKSTLL